MPDSSFASLLPLELSFVSLLPLELSFPSLIPPDFLRSRQLCKVEISIVFSSLRLQLSEDVIWLVLIESMMVVVQIRESRTYEQCASNNDGCYKLCRVGLEIVMIVVLHQRGEVSWKFYSLEPSGKIAKKFFPSLIGAN